MIFLTTKKTRIFYHEEHEEHEDFLNIIFVLFVFFVVKNPGLLRGYLYSGVAPKFERLSRNAFLIVILSTGRSVPSAVGVFDMISTTFIPSTTRPKIEYWPSHSGLACSQIKNWLVALFSSLPRLAAETIPLTCLCALYSAWLVV